MTEKYNMTMAARNHQRDSNAMAETITDRNYPRLEPDAIERMEEQLNRKTAFDRGANVGWVKKSMKKHVDDWNDIIDNKMKTIPEDRALRLKRCAPKQLPLKDTDQLAAFRQLLIKNEVDDSFRERLQEITQNYYEIATTNDCLRDSDLSLLRDEVQAQVTLGRMRVGRRWNDLLERGRESRGTPTPQAMVEKIETKLSS